MSTKWRATISESSPRAEVWQRILGTRTVPILSPLPIRGVGPDGEAEFYRLDVGEFDQDQRERVIEHLAARFGLGRLEVEHLMDDPHHGVPILAADVSVPMDLRYFT